MLGKQKHLSPTVVIALVSLVLGLLSLLPNSEVHAANGRICNRSSIPVWITVTEDIRQPPAQQNFRTYELAADQCTNSASQDAEALWVVRCNASNSNDCRLFAFKLGASYLVVRNTSLEHVIRIGRIGLGAQWLSENDIPGDWSTFTPSVSYRLDRPY